MEFINYFKGNYYSSNFVIVTHKVRSMNIEEVRNYCINKKGTTESFPFDEETLVIKVMGKMFALLSLEKDSINLKCDPEKAISLREHYDEITPGFHMSKKHWNTVDFSHSLSDELILEMIDHSYDLVVNALPKAKREELNNH